MDFEKFKPDVIPSHAERVAEGIWEWENPGARVVLPCFWSDPVKANEEYYDKERLGNTLDGFEREILISFKSWGGKRVFPEYNDALHLAKKDLPYYHNRPIVVGVDVPGPAAAVWGQLFPLYNTAGKVLAWKLHILEELFMEDSSILEFGEAIKDVCKTRFSDAYRIHFVADPAAFGTVGMDKRTAASILLQDCGIRLERGPINLTERLEGVRRWLKRTIPVKHSTDSAGAFQINPGCQMIIDAMRGGYHYKLEQNGTRFKEVPNKACDSSHIADALCYMVWKVRTPEYLEKPKEKWKPIEWNPSAIAAPLD